MKPDRNDTLAPCVAALLSSLVLSGCVAPQPKSGSEVVSLPQYVEPLSVDDLGEFERPIHDWLMVADVAVDPAEPKQFTVSDGSGVILNGPNGRTGNLHTALEHGDVELHVEFNVPQASNSGVYLQGRYEVQILDSWQKYQPTFADCGGIYQRYVDGRGFEGKAPRVNASLPPGEWQRFDIVFRAPRFDDDGKKLENARFVSVIHNGVVIHENVEVTGPTRSASFEDESAWGPIMFQGDHGPVAYRNLLVKHVVIP